MDYKYKYIKYKKKYLGLNTDLKGGAKKKSTKKSKIITLVSGNENKIKELTKATIRCIPNEVIEEAGFCILSGKKSVRRVLFAKAY